MLRSVLNQPRRKGQDLLAAVAASIFLMGAPSLGLAQTDEDGVSGESPYTSAVFQASCQTLQSFLSNGDVLYSCDAGHDQCDVIRGGALGFCGGNLETIHPALSDPLETNVTLDTILFGSILGTDPSPSATPPFTNTICQVFGTPGTAPNNGPPSGRILPAGGLKLCRRIEPGAGGDCRGGGSFCPSGSQTYLETVYSANACAAIRQILQASVSANPDPAFALFLDSSNAGRAGSEVLFVCDSQNQGPFRMKIASPANLCSAQNPADCLTGSQVVYRLPTDITNTPGCYSYRGTTYCK